MRTQPRPASSDLPQATCDLVGRPSWVGAAKYSRERRRRTHYARGIKASMVSIKLSARSRGSALELVTLIIHRDISALGKGGGRNVLGAG